jgi:hypothetical protein
MEGKMKKYFVQYDIDQPYTCSHNMGMLDAEKVAKAAAYLAGLSAVIFERDGSYVHPIAVWSHADH